MDQQQEKDIQDYIIAVRKRAKAIGIIFSIVFAITVAVAFLLPAIYKSSSTILIEQQEIPTELVMSTVTSYAAERIQTIQARVMTRTNLIRIVDKFKLYQDERKFETNQQIIERMIEDVSLDIISAEVVDPRTGRPSSATIAFSISFQGEEPAKVQRVTNELTTLYLNENLTDRKQQASEASRFFEQEKSRLADEIKDLENRLAEFKQANADALPEQQTLNLQLLQRKESELLTIDSSLRSLDERRFYLGGQLAQLSPGNPNVPGSAERLKVLQAEYASARARYSEEHPDVVRLKSEIDSLELATGSSGSASALAEQLKVLEAELAQTRKKYTAEHPDVVSLQSKVDSLSRELAQAKTGTSEDYYNAQPDNPVYITIKSQLAGVESEMNALKAQKAELQQRILKIEKSLYDSPQVEREYLVLKRDYENAVLRFQETSAKQMHADVARQLEAESKGERFTLIDPAILPEEPISPNRPALVLLGFILAVGSGLGFAIVADAISGTVRGARGVQRLLGAMPLAVIPYELNLQDRAKTKKIKKRVIILFIAVIIFALGIIHLFVTPLDVLWFKFLRKFEMMMA